LAEGHLLTFLDADDRWMPEHLERQVAFLLRSGAGLVYSDCRVVDADGRVLGRYLSRHQPARGDVFEALLGGNFVPLPTILVTRRLFDRSGGFAGYLRSASDYDWLLRAARHEPFDYLAEPLADYRVTPGSLTADFRASYRENIELLQDLEAVEESPETRQRIQAATSLVLWRWSVREALAGPGAWKDALGLAARAMRTVPGRLAGLQGLKRVLRDGFRGFGLRRRILGARKARS
jgi:hypothetical protein